MKSIIFVVFFLAPAVVYGQTKADYELAENRYVQYYNRGQADSICSLLSDDWGEEKAGLYSQKIMDRMKAEMGDIVSCKYLLVDTAYSDDYARHVAFFRVVYTKKENGSNAHAMSISLDEHKKIYAFNYLISSAHTDSLMAPAPKKRP